MIVHRKNLKQELIKNARRYYQAYDMYNNPVGKLTRNYREAMDLSEDICGSTSPLVGVYIPICEFLECMEIMVTGDKKLIEKKREDWER